MGRVVRGRRRVVLSNPDLRNEGGRREARFAGVKRILVCDWAYVLCTALFTYDGAQELERPPNCFFAVATRDAEGNSQLVNLPRIGLDYCIYSC